MADVFSGNLVHFKLIDVLRLLSSERKTGVLEVVKGTERGEIYLEGGRIVHATSRDGVGEEAFFKLITWLEGNFTFFPDAATEERTIERNTHEMLEEGSEYMKEWNEIKEVIPSQDIVFKLSSGGVSEEVTLRPEEWAVLSQIDGERTVGEIAQLTGKDEYQTAKVMFNLFLKGLIEIAAEPKRRARRILNSNFLDLLEARFKEVMGPIASFLMEEMIAELGEKREAFPAEKAAALVERMSAQITDEEQRVEFQQSALKVLREYS